MKTENMPTLNLQDANLTAEELELAEGIISKGHLRASKPDTKLHGGRTAYIWRMVAFDLVAQHPYCCMPVTADFDLDIEDYDARRTECQRLNKIADKVTNSLPPTQWKGALRWGHALGYL